MQPEPTDLAASHRDVLAAIAAYDEAHPPTGTDIAAGCAIHVDHVYQILSTLESQDLIERTQGPADNRVRHNTLTTQGVAVLRTLKNQYSTLELQTPPDHTESSTDDTNQSPPTEHAHTEGGHP